MITADVRRWTLTDALFLSLTALCALPAVLVRYPASVDYLNHLARLHILASEPDAPIGQFYEIHWSLIPNLAVDLLGAALHRVASPEAVMKGALVGATVELGLSIWFLHRSLFRHTQPTLLLCALCLFNLAMVSGFTNFALGLPLTFLALGGWIRMGSEVSSRSLVLLNVLGVAAYFAHIAALAALALTIVAYHCLQQPRDIRAIFARAAQLIPGFLLPALLVSGGAIQGRHDGPVHSGSVPIDFTIGKPFTPLAAFFSGRTTADFVTLCATAAILILCRGPIAPRLRPVLLIWIAVIVAAPGSIGTAVCIDTRLAIIPVLLYLSSIAFQPKTIPAPAFVVLVAALVITRVVTLIPSLELHDAHVRSFRKVDNLVPRGARVIVAAATAPGCDSAHSWELLEEHLPSLLSIDRDAFVSTVFAGDGMQPIRWKLNGRGTGRPNLAAPPFSVLEQLLSPQGQARLTRESPDIARLFGSYVGWTERYDYLALRDCAPERAPLPHLLLIARSDTYRIYQIVKSPPDNFQTAYSGNLRTFTK